MKPYCIDLDLLKIILFCKGVDRADWRVSASGQGFHIMWSCKKRTCTLCSMIEKKFDDMKRHRRDKKRPTHWRKVLWDIKGGKPAGPWHIVKKEINNEQKGQICKAHTNRRSTSNDRHQGKR